MRARPGGAVCRKRPRARAGAERGRKRERQVFRMEQELEQELEQQQQQQQQRVRGRRLRLGPHLCPRQGEGRKGKGKRFVVVIFIAAAAAAKAAIAAFFFISAFLLPRRFRAALARPLAADPGGLPPFLPAFPGRGGWRGCGRRRARWPACGRSRPAVASAGRPAWRSRPPPLRPFLATLELAVLSEQAGAEAFEAALLPPLLLPRRRTTRTAPASTSLRR